MRWCNHCDVTCSLNLAEVARGFHLLQRGLGMRLAVVAMVITWSSSSSISSRIACLRDRGTESPIGSASDITPAFRTQLPPTLTAHGTHKIHSEILGEPGHLLVPCQNACMYWRLGTRPDACLSWSSWSGLCYIGRTVVYSCAQVGNQIHAALSSPVFCLFGLFLLLFFNLTLKKESHTTILTHTHILCKQTDTVAHRSILTTP